MDLQSGRKLLKHTKNKELFLTRSVLQAAALITLLIALTLLIFPGQVLVLFDDNGHEQFAIYLGTALFGFSITNWLYSRLNDLSAVLPAIYGNIASLITALVIDVLTIFAASSRPSLWLILFLHLVFAAAFIYCAVLIKRPVTRNS